MGLTGTLDASAGLLDVGGATVRLEASAGLPVADDTFDRLTVDVAGVDATRALALMREVRRTLQPGATVAVEGFSPTASNGDDHPLDSDRLGRYAGLDATGTNTYRRTPRTDPDHPLVSILIPGYRTTFLDAALHSASAQDWPNVEILVGDDCPTDDVRVTVEHHAAVDDRIRYIGRAAERGGRPNMLHLLSEASGSYIKFLNDDDLLHPQCVRRMATSLQSHPSATLVTAHRQPIDAAGRELTDSKSTARRVPVDSRIRGASAAADIIERDYNWIGEPTSTMFRRSDLDGDNPFGVDDRVVPSCGDLALWLRLMSRGDLIYLTDTLTSFRRHPGQRQQQPEFTAIARGGLDLVMQRARQLGLGLGGPFVADPIELRPWWPAEAQRLVANLELDNATTTLDALDELLPNDTSVAILRAQVALTLGQVDDAIELLDEAADRDRGSVAALKLLGVALLHAGAPDVAFRMLWFAQERCPYDADLAATIAALSDQELEPA